MLDAIREMSENLAEMGFALAGKALSGVFAVVRDVALKVEAHTGISVPFAHSGTPVVVETEESVPTWQADTAEAEGKLESHPSSPPSGPTESAHVEARSPVVEETPVAASESKSAATRPSSTKGTTPSHSPSRKAAPRRSTAKKRASKSSAETVGRRSSSRSSKGKKRPGRSSQILRLLDILARDSDSWMSAVELAAATEEQGARILPGNVRKAIRLRAEGLIESRIRPGNKRGATEYRITDAGLAYLKKHKEDLGDS